MNDRIAPGEIRDAIIDFLRDRPDGASVAEIRHAVATTIKTAAPSSIRSYLRLNEETKFIKPRRGVYALINDQQPKRPMDGLVVPRRVMQFANCTRRTAWTGFDSARNGASMRS